MAIVIVTVLGTAIVLCLSVLAEKRLLKKARHWLCPECGEPFGVQEEYRTWGIRMDPFPEGWGFRPTSGILLECKRCQKDFQFTRDGRDFAAILSEFRVPPFSGPH